MDIFISWSGEASKRVALLLHEYLPYLIQNLSPFMSKQDLQSGGRWNPQLATELEKSNFGIICLTSDNMKSEWILFEAGALTKHFEGRACCLLLQGLKPTEVSGPLSQFQNQEFTEDGFYELLVDINELLDNSLKQVVLKKIFDNLWPELEEKVKATLVNIPPPSDQKRNSEDLLEELLLRTRNIQGAVETAPSSFESELSFKMLHTARVNISDGWQCITNEQFEKAQSYLKFACALLKRLSARDMPRDLRLEAKQLYAQADKFLAQAIEGALLHSTEGNIES